MKFALGDLWTSRELIAELSLPNEEEEEKEEEEEEEKKRERTYHGEWCSNAQVVGVL